MVYCPCTPSKQRGNQPHTFWFKPVSTFGLFWLTTIQQFTYVSHTTQPRPPPPDAGRLHVASRPHAIRRSGFIVLTASHPAVTSDACVSRLLMTEHQVP
ncbi:hypothetical protein ELZ88_24075 (plasmid) [Salmonella enterica subsp. enterica serovar Karamoja]|uniref:Uncharacterized protein n=1 Tax=Salmonella enterica subsp. enterica serovar Karamoja TaxID=2500153 RepID=A0A3Q9MTJ5_SALET|nr:hypothetical protein ELZ88_24075 [Salmonella enterica subsp. enterica serovar Karamoja]AZT44475.1 hypothetical protein EL007_23770 [Salmonella enterica subsp. enterica serovar Karamoja]